MLDGFCLVGTPLFVAKHQSNEAAALLVGGRTANMPPDLGQTSVVEWGASLR